MSSTLPEDEVRKVFEEELNPPSHSTNNLRAQHSDVSSTIQDSERVSENNPPDTIELLYIESPNIGLVEFRKRIEAYAHTQTIEAEKRGIAWTIKEIDDMHYHAGDDGSYKLDGIFKGIKNSIRDRAKMQAGYDPAPNYPITVDLTKLNKEGKTE